MRGFGEALRDYRLKVLGPDVADVGVRASIVLPPALAEAARQHASAIKLHALALVSALHERDTARSRTGKSPGPTRWTRW